MKTIWFASNNENKINEMKYLFPEIEIKSIKNFNSNIDIPENEPTFEGNSLYKAKFLANLVGEPVIADDSGICIEGLNNFPGIYSARWAKPEKDWNIINKMVLDKMLENNLINQEDRKAYFISVTSFVDLKNNIEEIFIGKTEGIIVKEQLGENGFAYDKIFKPLNCELTYAQMSKEEKSKISHRRKSIDLLKKFLKDHKYL
ncbi:RdgB/HAM1 family non-canonical purine NTP pyrophosphatase [Spiroplasma taiwanense]|uniref:dITP/XTP pyrophosphatase n=1 Tax=Spiroplasma taiwanense CT-1 TaxID=1276220 RepID=S5MB95_9MOLU|nr:RdgB/HAM1 family non-canonical purine NTP pyrophosphatase [Spiroplasma taiwanense]AGR41043.1 dITP/XTP pyrophosphatase [Spiroplasma taiwanense CT-1]